MTLHLPPLSPPRTSRQVVNPPDRETEALKTARQLEAGFLAQMLKSAGLDGAGAGSENDAPFASFRRQALADAIVERGGLGLAQQVFEAMMEIRHDKRK